MNTVDFIVILIVAGLVSLAISKIVRDKKKGVKCTGCSGCPECPACSACSDTHPQK